MADSENNVEEVEATEVDSANEVKTADDKDVVSRAATEESDLKRRDGNIIERGGKLANAEDVLKVTSKETDINPLDGNEIDKDSQFNPTKGI